MRIAGAMESKMPSVLLIGERSHGSSYLASSLDKRGCECSFASSCQEAFLILRDQKFDLVLSPTSLRDGTLYSIMSLLEGSGTTVFYSCVVEDSCWWLPALRCGQKRFGSPALRPSEFVTLLEETIKEIQGVVPAAPENRSLLVFRADASVMSASRPRAKVMAVNPARVEKQELVKRKAAG
jgi:DNA-binding NtrC family response regulator